MIGMTCVASDVVNECDTSLFETYELVDATLLPFRAFEFHRYGTVDLCPAHIYADFTH